MSALSKKVDDSTWAELAFGKGHGGRGGGEESERGGGMSW